MRPIPSLSPADKLKDRLVVVGILLLGFVLRIFAIDQIPAGLSHDEAYNGVMAIQVLEGKYHIFFEINKGIEPLIIYLEALAFYLFGIGPVSLRWVNIVFGMLTIALVYPFTARLFDHRVALLAMAGVSVSFWAVFVSRLTLRAMLLPPFLLLTLYFFWRGLNSIIDYQLSINKEEKFRLSFYALSGVWGGLTMYTYLSSRFVPFITATMFGYFVICRRVNRYHWLGLFLHFLVFLGIFAPLGYYFIENYESFTHRADQVMTIPRALEGDLSLIIRHTGRTLGMFTLQGDTTDRYNLNGRPIFDWVNGLLFYLGIAIILKRFLHSPGLARTETFLLVSFFFMLLPGFITDDSPHFLRTIGALPFVYIFWAVGLAALTQKAEQRQKEFQGSFPTLRITPYALYFISPSILIFLLLSLTTLHTSYDYFYRWATAENARYIYGADIAEIADHLKTAPNQDLPAISAEYYRDLDPFRFTLHFQGRPPFALWFDGRQSLAFPPTGSTLAPRYIFPASAPVAEVWKPLLEFSAAESGQGYNLYRQAHGSYFADYLAGMRPIDANFNNDLVLLGYQLLGEVRAGETFQIVLSWQALRTLPPGTDYTFLVQMEDEQSRPWLKVDGNGYDPGNWQSGVLGLQLLTLRLPEDLAPQRYHLTLQVIDRQRGQALLMANGETSILLDSVTIETSQ